MEIVNLYIGGGIVIAAIQATVIFTSGLPNGEIPA